LAGESKEGVPQIAAVTGHSLKDVEASSRIHLGRDIQLAKAAVLKLEARPKL